jgi:DNA polymerase III subunit delta'
MSSDLPQNSGIVVTSDIESQIALFEERLRDKRVVAFVREEFKVEDAKAVIAEAYISEAALKYIFIASKKINPIAQNSLLKLLEEPPQNIRFLLFVTSKAVLLPTIRSRLPILYHDTIPSYQEIDLNFATINQESVWEFLKQHERISKEEAKGLLEGLYHRATRVDGLVLTQKQMECFEKGYRLLDLNTQSGSVFALVLLSFVTKDV